MRDKPFGHGCEEKRQLDVEAMLAVTAGVDKKTHTHVSDVEKGGGRRQKILKGGLPTKKSEGNFLKEKKRIKKPSKNQVSVDKRIDCWGGGERCEF